MKRLSQMLLKVFAVSGIALPGQAVVLVDDTWADGTRVNQNLPTESAWFTSQPTLVAVAPGYMSLTNRTGAASEWTTYFTPPGTVSPLAVGDTLTVTLDFAVTGLASATNIDANFRIGLVNSSAGATRLTNDANVTSESYLGYALFCNFGPVFGRFNGCFSFRRRSPTPTGSTLLGTAADWTTVANGGSFTDEPAFTNNGVYTLTLTATRDSESSVTLTAAYTGGGLTNMHSATDFTGVFTSFDCLTIRPSDAETTATNFVFKRFKVEGPSAVPPAAAIGTQPRNQSLVVAESAYFRVSAGGAAPLHYQWYFNTATPVPDATNATLWLANIQPSQAGDYTLVVTNSVGAATSQVATLTVDPPVYTSMGVVMDDRWADGDRFFGPVGISNSQWFAADPLSLTAVESSMLATPNISSSRLWVGYFTDELSPPVDIDVGHALKVTLVFTPTNVAPKNTSNIRFGLFTYANGATRLSSDVFSSSAGNAPYVRGYMFSLNFGTSFGDDTPLSIRRRDNLESANLLSTVNIYPFLGSGPAGSSNAPAIASGTQYTWEFTVARIAESTVSLTARISGGGLDLSHTETDGPLLFRRFDSLGIRANSAADSAAQINITRFLVQVVEADVPFRITAIERPAASSIKLTWQSISNQVYQVQSRDSLSSGSWVTNHTVTAMGSSTSFTNTGLGAIPKRYYRLVKLP